MFNYFAFAGLSTICLASSNVTQTTSTTASSVESKSKRQLNHQTRVAVAPISGAERHLPSQITQTIYGQHTPGQYISRPLQADQEEQHSTRQQHLQQPQQQQQPEVMEPSLAKWNIRHTDRAHSIYIHQHSISDNWHIHTLLRSQFRSTKLANKRLTCHSRIVFGFFEYGFSCVFPPRYQRTAPRVQTNRLCWDILAFVHSIRCRFNIPIEQPNNSASQRIHCEVSV